MNAIKSRRTYSKGDLVGHYLIVAKTDRSIGHNKVYKVKCTLCQKQLEKVPHNFKIDHQGCFRFNKHIVMKKSR